MYSVEDKNQKGEKSRLEVAIIGKDILESTRRAVPVGK
jgi:hypothetical protein